MKLALDGGTPVRADLLAYGRHCLEEADIQAVCEVLRGDWLTTGPKVVEFEQAVAERTGAAGAVAVNSGTAALHAAMAALDLGPEDEVIVPAMTFAASGNAVFYVGARPVIADVDSGSLLLGVAQAAERLTPRTRALVAVDYAGQPCDYAELRAFCAEHSLTLVADACHALGATYGGRAVGSLADLTTFSFHPVKPITTGEGGMITSDRQPWLDRMRQFRNHGMSSDFRQREKAGGWVYEISSVGFNYRLSDLQCALGLSQLARLEEFTARRQELARGYRELLRGLPLRFLDDLPGRSHAYHLFVVRLQLDRLRVDRAQIFRALRAEGIGVNVHYIPIHFHPLYRERLGTGPGLCPEAERAYEEMLTLPIHPLMQPQDQADVAEALAKVLGAYSR